ncbi:hypothetical protein EON65_45845 [archaeon]|nr:MAG: hypothetical protein EON65_45845 [archaeon]
MFPYSASKRYPRTPTARIFPSFIRLSDDLLCRILFSGYLGSRLDDLVYVLLVSKRFLSLGYLATSVFMSDNWATTNLMVTKLKNLTFLNLQFLPCAFTSTMMEVLLCRKTSLKVLNLRGTLVNDDSVSVIAMLENLESLVLGKSERLPDELGITDNGAQHLVKLANLTFLDLSMTNITDATLIHLSTHLSKLKHLRLQCCNGITNISIEALSALPLRVLDVSSCVGLNAGIVDMLAQSK